MSRHMLRIRLFIAAVLIALACAFAFGPRAAHAGDAPGGGHTPLVATPPAK